MVVTAKELRDAGVKNIATSVADADTTEDVQLKERDLGSGVERWLIGPAAWQDTDFTSQLDDPDAPAHAPGSDQDNYDATVASLPDVWKR